MCVYVEDWGAGEQQEQSRRGVDGHGRRGGFSNLVGLSSILRADV